VPAAKLTSADGQLRAAIISIKDSHFKSRELHHINNRGEAYELFLMLLPNKKKDKSGARDRTTSSQTDQEGTDIIIDNESSDAVEDGISSDEGDDDHIEDIEHMEELELNEDVDQDLHNTENQMNMEALKKQVDGLRRTQDVEVMTVFINISSFRLTSYPIYYSIYISN
jgi:hypothetical protein